MPFCSKCGNELGEGDAFCPKCGATVEKTDAVKPEPPQGESATENFKKEQAADVFGIEDDTQEKKNSHTGLTVVLVVLGIGLLVYLLSQADSSSGKGDQAALQKTQVVSRSERIQACFSHWDGSQVRIERYLKDGYLNDPDSYEHVSTKYAPLHENSDTLLVVTVFSARNGFGGRVRSSVIYKTVIPKATTPSLEDPDWCPVFDVVVKD